MSRQGRAGFRGWSGKRGPPGSQAAAARARGRFAQFCGVLTLESFASTSLGLAVGSFAPSTDAALAIGPCIMVLFIVVRCPGPARAGAEAMWRGGSLRAGGKDCHSRPGLCCCRVATVLCRPLRSLLCDLGIAVLRCTSSSCAL
jgi:hypothetical protein